MVIMRRLRPMSEDEKQYRMRLARSWKLLSKEDRKECYSMAKMFREMGRRIGTQLTQHVDGLFLERITELTDQLKGSGEHDEHERTC